MELQDKHNSSLKVLMFGWEFPPHNSGGLGVACEGLSRGLSEMEAEICFVLPKKMNCHSDHCRIIFADIEDSIKKTKVNSPLTPYITSEEYQTSLSKNEMHEYGANLLEEVERYGKQASKIALSQEFDVIHAHDWLSFSAGIEAKKASGKPLVVHVHATEFDRTGNNRLNQKVYEYEKQGMEKADKIIAVSNFTKSILVDKYQIEPEKIEVVHNGFEDENPEKEVPVCFSELKRNNKKIVLFLGRLTLQKGPDYFIQAARKVLDKDPNVLFMVAGSGDMEKKLIEETAHLDISDKVLFAGFLRGKKLWQAYKAADLYVMPSVSEPFGISPLEALSKETPTLISKQTGVSEVLSNTIKVDFWDTNKMADRILSIINYPELHSELTKNGNRELKKITWKEAARKCMNIYNNLVQNTIPLYE